MPAIVPGSASGYFRPAAQSTATGSSSRIVPAASGLGALGDDFATNDQTKWTDLAAVTVTGGQLQLATNSAYDGERRSRATYDLTGSSAYVQLVQVPSILTGAGLVETYFMLYAGSSSNSVFWDVQSGTINAKRRLSGATTTIFTATYDAAVHKWLRIRNDTGTIYWDSSVDGVTWTQRASWAVSGLTITAMTVLMGAGRDTGITATPAIYDNFNTPAPAAGGTLTSRWTGAATQTGATVAIKTSGAATARLKVATDAGLTTGIVFGSAVTPDSNGEAKATITGLTAGTQYYYGVEVDGVVDTVKTGKFRTAPSGATSFSFVFGSCSSNPNSTTYTAIQARNPDLFLHLGDFAYTDITTNNQALFRGMYDTALAASNQGSLLANIPTVYLWSDHDYGTNDSDSTSASKPAAQAVYRARVPHYPLAVSDGIYHTFVWGRVRFIVTDLRSFRTPDSATDDASKSMMGATQKQWFKDTITAATEPVIVWVSEVPWNSNVGLDAWFAFSTERTELASFITASGKSVAIIGGDEHALAADDGTNTVGHLPVFQAGPLDDVSSAWSGPNTAGNYPLTDGTPAQQYGLVAVTDTGGSTITFAYTGYDVGGTARITQSVSVTSKTLVDTGTATDALTVAVTTGLTDSGTGIDAITVSSATPVALTDTGTLSDAAAVAVRAPSADAATSADTFSVAASVPLTDAGTGTDTASVAAAAPLTDTSTATDVITVTVRVPLPDTATGADGIAIPGAGNIPLPDTGTSAETITATARTPLADSGAGVDQAAVAARVPITDTGTSADALTVGVAPQLTDTAATVDAITVRIAVTLTDTAAATDALTVSAAVTLTDTATGTDQLTLPAPPVVAAPAETYIVPAESQSFLVPGDALLFTIAAESLTATVPPQTLTYVVPPQPALVTVGS